MPKFYYILCLFLMTTIVVGQKRMEKIVSTQDILTLAIDGTSFSEIHIIAKDVPTIHLIATIAGETF